MALEGWGKVVECGWKAGWFGVRSRGRPGFILLRGKRSSLENSKAKKRQNRNKRKGRQDIPLPRYFMVCTVSPRIHVFKSYFGVERLQM